MVLYTLPISSLNTGKKHALQSVVCRSYKHADCGIVQELIRCSQWDDYFTTDSLEIVISLLYRNITLCMDTVAPKKTVKLHKYQAEYIPRALRN